MREASERRLAAGAAIVAVVLLLVTAISGATSGPALTWSPNDGTGDDPAMQQQDQGEQPRVETRCTSGDCEADNSVFEIIVVGVMIVGAIALLVALIVLFRNRALRPRLRRRASSLGVPGTPLPDVGAAVRDDVEQQYAALRTGAPRNAIVACWIRLEDAVISAGLHVRGSETSTELTHRVLATYLVDDTALVRLAALYREARFSRHDITESMRDEAVDALGRLHEGLTKPAASEGVKR